MRTALPGVVVNHLDSPVVKCRNSLVLWLHGAVIAKFGLDWTHLDEGATATHNELRYWTLRHGTSRLDEGESNPWNFSDQELSGRSVGNGGGIGLNQLS